MQTSLASPFLASEQDGEAAEQSKPPCGPLGRVWRKMGLTLQTILSVVVGALIGLLVRPSAETAIAMPAPVSVLRNCTLAELDLVAMDASTSEMFVCNGTFFASLAAEAAVPQTSDWILLLAYPGDIFINALKLLCVPFVFVSMVQAVSSLEDLNKISMLCQSSDSYSCRRLYVFFLSVCSCDFF